MDLCGILVFEFFGRRACERIPFHPKHEQVNDTAARYTRRRARACARLWAHSDTSKAQRFFMSTQGDRKNGNWDLFHGVRFIVSLALSRLLYLHGGCSVSRRCTKRRCTTKWRIKLLWTRTNVSRKGCLHREGGRERESHNAEKGETQPHRNIHHRECFAHFPSRINCKCEWNSSLSIPPWMHNCFASECRQCSVYSVSISLGVYNLLICLWILRFAAL